MKKVIFVITLLAVIAAFLAYSMTKSFDISTPFVPELDTKNKVPEAMYKTVTYNNKTYAYALYSAKQDTNINLIANFSQKLTSEFVASKSGCTSLINGGFYDTHNAPLGLFITNGDTIGKRLENPLVNGYVLSDTESNISIRDTVPDESSKWIFQTGPFLVADGKVLGLSIRNDTYARRSVITVDNSFIPTVILIMFSDHNDSGPRLTDVPAVVQLIAQSEGLHVKNAINLDGGGASAFISGNVRIIEHDPVGSFICFR